MGASNHTCEELAVFGVFFMLTVKLIFLKRLWPQYHFKFGFAYFSALAITGFWLPIFLFKPRNVTNLRKIRPMAACLGWILGVRYKVINSHFIKKDKSAVLVCNHQSTLDVLALMNLTDLMDAFTVIAKRALLFIWPFGPCAWLAGAIFVDRKNPVKSYQSLDEAKDWVKQSPYQTAVNEYFTYHGAINIHMYVCLLLGVFSVKAFNDLYDNRQIPGLDHSSIEKRFDDEVASVPGQWRSIVVDMPRELPDNGLPYYRSYHPAPSREQLSVAYGYGPFKGCKFWFFAEGTRNQNVNRNRTLLPFKKGAFRIAIACQVPIIPIVNSPYYFVNKSQNFFSRGMVITEILPPIPTTGMTQENVEELMKTTQKLMQEKFHHLFGEVEAVLPEKYPGLL